ncbi:hypothetical protein HY416_02760 [Candidatus Kaiserbacteria bacterium]|nr:hypothetical protein [Candidatus Kaiserbacteria bacterium]
MNFPGHVSRRGVFRIGGAIAFGAGMVGVAFFVNHRALQTQTATVPAIVVARGDVRTMRPAPDSDGDRIPDWEEALEGTDPHTYTTIVASTSTPPVEDEPYERPATLTGRFAEYFLKDIVRTGAGKDITPEDREALVSRSVSTLASATEEKLYTRADIKTGGGNDMVALYAYGNAVGDIFIRNRVERETEDKFTILKRAMDAHDPDILRQLKPIEDAYAGLVTDLLALETPASVARQHVDLINALSMVHTDVAAMGRALDDPLGTMMYIKRYQDDARGLSYAFDQVRAVLESSDIAYASDESGITLFRFRP